MTSFGNYFQYRLYRQHISYSDETYYKDLNKLGRDLSKTIIIDNLPENYSLHPSNGLFISSWTDDINDSELYDIKKILIDIVKQNVNDVRKVIKQINNIVQLKNTNLYKNIRINSFCK